MRKILLISLLMMATLLSCYDGMIETYDNSIVYKLGDTGPAGGLICYINPDWENDGWRYLEAAPKSTEFSNIEWGKNGDSVTGTQKTIGTGYLNTGKIIVLLNTPVAETGRAAQICDNLSIEVGGVIYDDWFLPSLDELNLMYENLAQKGIGSFTSDHYWCSSEYDASFAWNQGFDDGYQGWNSKNGGGIRVRAIRAF